MTDGGTSTPPPGWYDDPSDITCLRYWDGWRWTDHRTLKPLMAPRGASGSVGTPAIASASTPVGHTSGMPWWGWLIIAMVAVFTLLGVLVTLAWQAADGGGVQVTEERDFEPAPEPTIGEPAYGGFGEGVYIVGEDIAAGTYRMSEPEVRDGPTVPCYWQISEAGDVLDNEAITGGTATITVIDGQELDVRDCGLWVRVDPDDLFANPHAYPWIPDGTWLVGEDVAAGDYRADSEIVMDTFYDKCFVEIAEGVESNFNDIVLDEHIEEGRPEVTLAVGQQFTTFNCGSWSPTDTSGADSVQASLLVRGN